MSAAAVLGGKWVPRAPESYEQALASSIVGVSSWYESDLLGKDLGS